MGASWGRNRDDWHRVQRLKPGTMLELQSEKEDYCRFVRADDHSVTCGKKTYARDTVVKITRSRNTNDAEKWGARAGALFGVGVGAALGARGGWGKSAALGTAGLPIGAAAGWLAGCLFSPENAVVYVRRDAR